MKKPWNWNAISAIAQIITALIVIATLWIQYLQFDNYRKEQKMKRLVDIKSVKIKQDANNIKFEIKIDNLTNEQLKLQKIYIFFVNKKENMSLSSCVIDEKTPMYDDESIFAESIDGKNGEIKKQAKIGLEWKKVPGAFKHKLLRFNLPKPKDIKNADHIIINIETNYGTIPFYRELYNSKKLDSNEVIELVDFTEGWLT